MVQRFVSSVNNGFTVAVFGTFVLLMSLSFDSLLGIHKQRFVCLFYIRWCVVVV
jgi:hypothetical protein